MTTEPTEKDTEAEGPESFDMGIQPLEAWLTAHGLNNHEVVAAAVGTGLTHKVVAKARKGRQLTAKAQKKIHAALTAVCKARQLPPPAIGELFNYRGR